MIAAVQRMPAEVAFVIFTRTAFLAALVVLLAAVSPHFLTTDNMVIVLRQAALQFLMSAGLTLVVLTGGIDLSIGAVLGLGACLGAGFIASGSLLLGVAAALGAGLACGLVNGALVAYVGIPAFIATYGMLWVAHGLGYVFMKGEVIHGFPAAFRTLGAGFVGAIPVPVLIGAGILIVLHVVLHLTRFGRALYAIGGNAVAAKLSGMPTKRYLVTVYALSGVLAAFAGLVVIARVNAADSGTGEELLLTAIAAVCLGGTSLFGGAGGVVGTAIGSLILALVVNGMNMLNIATFWQAFAMGVIVILAVLADVSFKRRMQ
ncbi:MAG TPA: ABC transporter permease [Burkholderiales bacterium]|nr:ABC transporter permease [Burkholderiales bacterium]